MMLVRVRGGAEGIVQYLQEGQKSGREYSRDELDERLVLAGDLEVTDRIIIMLEDKVERYKHITLGFKEDEISPEILTAIVEEFKDFMFAAYRSEEYNFYAEAHLPKIKSYDHKETGALIERKPHIHIVVPKINILTGNTVDPFGWFNLSEKYLSAWQTYINDKYGLSDPQANRRVIFTDASEMISRYKGDTFVGSNYELRGKILDAIISRGVTSYDEFSNLLGEFGTVRHRNAGKPSMYANVLLPGEKKGINLKDYVFSPAFLVLSSEDKRRCLELENHRRYEAISAARKSSIECEELLIDWHELRSKEAKYINSGNRKFYSEYKAMSREQKLAVLVDRESRFYRKHLGEDYERNIARATYTRASAFERIRDNLRSASADLSATQKSVGNIDCTARVVAARAAQQTLTTSIDLRAADRTQNKSSVRSNTRAVTEHAGNGVIDFYIRQLGEKNIVTKASQSNEFAEIKQNLNAGRLLSHLSKSHGVIADKYEVSRGKDGSERIKCGNRNLNVSDFLTKEMNLAWKEAVPILRNVYAAQRQNVFYQSKQQTPARELWSDFQHWKKNEVSRARDAAIYNIRTIHDKAIVQATKQFNAARSRIEDDRRLQRTEAKRLIDIEKAKREHTKKLARDSRNVAIQAEREKWSMKNRNLYKRFLAEVAQTDEPYAETALAELRNLEPGIANREDAVSYITAADRRTKEQGTPIKRDMCYSVDMKGHITYKIDGREALKDEGQRVNILQENDNDVIEQGLYLAKSKFGKVLTLHGSDQFKVEAVRIAVEKNVSVDFSDQHLQQLKQQLEQQKHDVFEKFKSDQANTRDKVPLSVQKQGMADVIPESQPPYKQYGIYKGEVLAVNKEYVYQRCGKFVIHHLLTQFNKVPKIGDNIAIRYTAGKIIDVKGISRGIGYDR